MIIDCHGHYTTAPAAHKQFRDAQLARLADPSLPEPAAAEIGDDEIRESVESNQLRLLRERGGDLMIFSPQASSMEHHVPDPATARAWARACNDLIARVVELFPDNFAGACQLPQTPGGKLDDSVAELERMGFPVWSKCVSALGTVKATLGDVNVGIVCAGQWVEPGDVVVADDDGVVVVPRARAADVLDACRAREEKETASRARYRAGELSLDVQGMREALAQKGLRYVDE